MSMAAPRTEVGTVTTGGGGGVIPPTFQWPRKEREAPNWFLRRLAGAFVAVVVIAGAVVLARRPPVVDVVHIVNRTDLELNVKVRSLGAPGVMGIGIAQPHRTLSVTDVIDHGDVWIFIATHGDERIFAERMTRMELDRTGWRIVISQDSSSAVTAAPKIHDERLEQ